MVGVACLHGLTATVAINGAQSPFAGKAPEIRVSLLLQMRCCMPCPTFSCPTYLCSCPTQMCVDTSREKRRDPTPAAADTPNPRVVTNCFNTGAQQPRFAAVQALTITRRWLVVPQGHCGVMALAGCSSVVAYDRLADCGRASSTASSLIRPSARFFSMSISAPVESLSTGSSDIVDNAMENLFLQLRESGALRWT